MNWKQAMCSCGHGVKQHYFHDPVTHRLLDAESVLPTYVDVRGCWASGCKCMEFDCDEVRVPNNSAAHDVIKAQREAYLESVGT